MVFSESLATHHIIEQLLSESTSDSSSASGSPLRPPKPPPYTTTVDNLEMTRTVYKAGSIVHHAIKDAPDMKCSWPPTSHDLNESTAKDMVPIELYNLLAYCIA